MNEPPEWGALPDEDDEAWRDSVEDTTQKRPLRLVRGEGEGRPDVRIGPDVHRVIDDTVAGLRVDERIFQRAHELVTVIGSSPDDRARVPFTPGAPIIRHFAGASLLPRLTRHMRFVAKKRTKQGEEKWYECPPPKDIVNGVLALGEWPGVRHLVGITETPLLRPDGAVCQERGYDPVTGYMYWPNAEYQDVEEAPTQQQAADAYLTLTNVFADFPYASAHHAAVPIAAILSVLARPAIQGAVPAFLFDASTRGSGKTLQCDVVSLIAMGRTAARANYPDKDEELEKTLSSYAMAGAQLILLDNVTRTLGGGPLDSVLTCREDVEFRILGRTETKRLPWRAVLMVSGNNLQLGEDTTRRAVVARLETNLENPEERTNFKHPDLIAWVREWRPTLVHAALTILRAYTAAGSPDMGCGVWGSFEEWSRLIPHAIVYAGGHDPLIARCTKSEAMNETRRSLIAVLHGINRLTPSSGDGYPRVPLSAKAILNALYPEQGSPPREFEDLRDAIEFETNCLPGKRPDPKRVGKYLARIRGRVVGGLMLQRVDGPGHSAAWLVVGVPN